MSELTKKEKIELIKELCAKHYITPFEIGNNTEISDVGAANIIKGISTNPREKTVDTILKYLEKTIVGKKIPGHTNNEAQQVRDLVAETTTPYYTQAHAEVMSSLNKLIEGQTQIILGVAETLDNTTTMKTLQGFHDAALNRITALLDNARKS
ncbi:hypothetical protein [Patiriisocius marinus]|uniref:hypothetical protein n=1 Tax=Patiriisocius marinus TaxID=1397112 RepID=UPI002330A084|nr:hypothetical protein [Patiriisocius marinus]